MRAPSLPFLQFLRRAPGLLSDRPGALHRIAQDHGDLVRVPIPGKAIYLVSSPKLARRILQSNAKNYRKSFDFKIVRTFLGEGLITIHDEKWVTARRAAKPALRSGTVDAMVDTMTGVIESKRDQWPVGEPFYVLAQMTDLTLKILTLALFGVDVEVDAEPISKAVNVCLRHLDKRLAALVDFDAFMPTPSGRRFARSLAYLDGVLDGWIAEATKGDVEGLDLMSTLIRASWELDDSYDRTQWLRDQVITFLMAGHETSAVAMSWGLYQLSQRPDLQERLAEEEAAVLGGRTPTREDVPRLELHRRVMREILRLYSPVWALGREAVEADELGGYDIPAGATVVICPYIIHRHPDHWEDPERFDPERFAEDPEKGRADFTWLPFSSGPRYCMGARLGMLELQLILVMTLQRFRIGVQPGFVPGREALISLRPRPDIPLLLEPRARS